MQHINDTPLAITNNGTTPVSTTIPATPYWNKDGITIYNPESTAVLFVKSGGAGTTADTTCNFVPPGQTKKFRKLPTDTILSTVLSAAGTGTSRANSEGAFDSIN